MNIRDKYDRTRKAEVLAYYWYYLGICMQGPWKNHEILLLV
jgi:hypothetical protein